MYKIKKYNKMKNLILVLFIGFALNLNATIINKAGNVIEVKENGPKHALITIYDNASDTAVIIEQFSTYIGNQLEIAKDSAIWVEGKTLEQAAHELLEVIIIEESKNGGLYKFRPDLDAILIEELKIKEQ